MGFVLVPFSLVCLFVSTVFGVLVTTATSFLLTHRADRLSFRVFVAWLPGGVPTGLLWGRFVEWVVPPLANDWAIREQSFSILFTRIALYAAWPGATLLGGAIAQLLFTPFVRKSTAPKRP